MAIGERDPVTGRLTTGHDWNGIKELDTPIPRIVLLFLAATALFSFVYWVLMPAWPVGTSYTKGLLGVDQRDRVTAQVEAARASRASWTSEIESRDYVDILADDALMQVVRESGHTLFGDNCAVCHGTGATGGDGFPSLRAGSWLWGGEPEEIAETIRVGINSDHVETRMAQMLAFGRDGMLDRGAVNDVVAYVQSLDGAEVPASLEEQVASGAQIFADNCAACHGEDGTGMTMMGAPDLTDDHWIYGGDSASIYRSVYSGRQGHMPHWEGRLSPIEQKILTLYVLDLGRD